MVSLQSASRRSSAARKRISRSSRLLSENLPIQIIDLTGCRDAASVNFEMLTPFSMQTKPRALIRLNWLWSIVLTAATPSYQTIDTRVTVAK